MKFFVLHKNGRTKLTGNSLFRNADGQLCVWLSEEKALAHAALRKSSWETWRVRPANSQDFQGVAEQQSRHKSYLPVYSIMDKE